MIETSNTANAAGMPVILRLRDVIRVVGLSRPTVYRMVKAGTFPAQVQLSAATVGWLRSEVEQWINERQRRGSMPGKGLTLASVVA